MFGDQKNFDKNGDGHLSSSEWLDWYYTRFGHDIEMAERRAVSQAVSEWEQWLNTTYSSVEYAYKAFLEGTKKLLSSWSKEKENLTNRAFFHWVCRALINGKTWQRTVSTHCAGEFVSDRSFRPYYRLAEAFAERHTGLCTGKELYRTLLRNTPPFTEEGSLSETRCGCFWNMLFAPLSPYREGALDDQVLWIGLPEDEVMQDLTEGLLDAYVLFADISEKAEDRERKRILALLRQNWSRLCGCMPEDDIMAISKASDELEIFDAQLADGDMLDWDADYLRYYENKNKPIFEAFLALEPEKKDCSLWQQWKTDCARIEAETKWITERRAFCQEREAAEKAAETERLRKIKCTYCTVYVPWTDQEYVYFQADVPVKVGDIVVVPFGKKREVIGEVRAIRDGTGADAPYPLERIKKILRLCRSEDITPDRIKARNIEFRFIDPSK